MKNKILIFITVLVSFLSGAGLVLLLVKGPLVNDSNNNGNTTNSNVSYSSCSNCMSGTMVVNNEGLSQSVNKIYDSVVMISNYQKNTLAGSGSGFVYKKDNDYGYIMTNQHVVDDATKLEVTFTSGNVVEGELLGGDEYLDIAVIRVPVSSVISIAQIGSTEDLGLGETVFAVGTPVGEEYFNSVSGGYISGLNRKVTVSVQSTSDWVQEVIQIDVAINPGNSGGPLVNFNGEVIGVTSLKLVDSSIEGMGFAIKIEDAFKHIEDLENGNKIQRPLLGITNVNATDTYTLRQYGIKLDSEIKSGIAVISVVEGSGADKAGLQKGDVIIKLNDDEVTNVAYLKYLLYKYSAGDTIELTYIRDNETKTAEVTLTENTD